MNLPDHDLKLKSSFVISGKLKVPTAELGKRLITVPNLKPIRGDALAFTLMELGGRSHSDLKILGNKFIFNYRFKRKSPKEHAINLIKLLSILVCINELYEPELASIYPSIMEVLADYAEEKTYGSKKTENIELLIRKQKLLSDANCSLSFKILDFQAQNAKLKDEKEILVKFSRDVIYGAMERTGINASNVDAVSKLLGTTTEKYKAVWQSVFEKESA